MAERVQAPDTPAQALAAPPFRPTQEIRFAVVMYGGVSLAIYIHGAVQELLRLVRATAPEVPTGGRPDRTRFAADELSPIERVYRELGQSIRWRSPALVGEPSADAPVTTRFVVDILSGSSAGGINAIFLAKALANEQSLEEVKRLWVDEGDLALLVNDRDSYRGLEGLKQQRPPRSLLNSQRMYWKLLSALDGMDEHEAPPPDHESRLVDELDCWITATDIRGLALPIDLFDRVVFERRHRHVFHFVYASPYASGVAPGEEPEPRNDFPRPSNPFLAFAARATASFPFAFEPMVLEDVDEVVRLDRFRRRYRTQGSGHEGWRRFFDEYVHAEEATGPDAPPRPQPFARRAFGDGGYLDNKPFTWATGTLRRRRADLPIDRRLIYVEPDPGRIEEEDPNAPRPDPLQNVYAALLGLPRAETIREDLERLLERNREIARLDEISRTIDLVDLSAPTDATTGVELAIPSLPANEWRQRPLWELIKERGLQWAAYHRLQVASVLDDLAGLVTRLAGFDPDSDQETAIRCLVQVWFDQRYENEHDPRGLTQTSFLLDFDLRYRLRRLRFVQDRLLDLMRDDPRTARLLAHLEPGEAAAMRDESFRQALLEFRARVNDVFIGLRASGRSLRRPAPGARVLELLGDLGLSPDDLNRILDGAKDRGESVVRAATLLEGRDLHPLLTELADEIARRLGVAFDTARAEMDALRTRTAANPGEVLARAAVDYFYVRYENYDAVIFPVSYGQLGEAARVEVIRVSPGDATSLIDENREDRRKLGGTSLGHFGGFLKEDWRRGDMLWGRLDTAERLIDTLLRPEDAPEGEVRDALERKRRRLLRQAQVAIVEEELVAGDRSRLVGELLARLLGGSEPADGSPALRAAGDLVDHLDSSYTVDPSLEPASTLHTAGRATRVAGLVLDGVSERYPVKHPARWLVRVGRALFGLVEVATPRRFGSILFRYWFQLALLLAAVLVLGGSLFGAPAGAKAGWTLLVLAIGTRVLVWVAADFLRVAKTGARRVGLLAAGLVLAAVVAAAAGLAALELVLHLGEDANALVEKLPDRLEDALRWLWPWDDGRGPGGSRF